MSPGDYTRRRGGLPSVAREAIVLPRVASFTCFPSAFLRLSQLSSRSSLRYLHRQGEPSRRTFSSFRATALGCPSLSLFRSPHSIRLPSAPFPPIQVVTSRHSRLLAGPSASSTGRIPLLPGYRFCSFSGLSATAAAVGSLDADRLPEIREPRVTRYRLASLAVNRIVRIHIAVQI